MLHLINIACALTLSTLLPFAFTSFTTADTSATKSNVINEKNDFQSDVEKIKEYLVVQDETYVFNLGRALQDGSPQEILQAGQYYNNLISNSSFLNSLEPDYSKISMPVWGNWCGPGHGSGAVLDTLDFWCKKHDLCYANRGYFDCICDKQLRDGITHDSHKMKANERAMAAAIVVYFSITPCVPH